MAGEPTARLVQSVYLGGVSFGGRYTLSADTVIAFQKSFPTGENVEADVNLIDISNLALLVIEASKDCDVYTNDTSEGEFSDHLALKADHPLIFQKDDPAASLFLTADVTKIYVTTTATTVLKIGVLQDVTPVL